MAGLGTSGTRVAKTIKLFIGGEFPRTESGRSYPVNTHGSDQVYAHLCRASRKDLRNAVTAAQGAVSAWAGRTAYNRAQILYRMAEMAEGKRAEFAEILRETRGVSDAIAAREIDAMVDAFVYHAGFCDKYQQLIAAVNPVSGPHHCFTTAEPVGLVALLSDARATLSATAGEIAAVIASGNVVVALLGDDTAPALSALGEVFATSDLPKGVVNLLSGSADELAEHFGSHMEIQSVSFQHDDPKLSEKIKTLAAENMKRFIPRSAEPLSLEHLLSFVEYKTLWHPVGV